MSPRFWEIDFLRGFAIVLMVIFNYAFTLRFFGLFDIENHFFWFWFPRIIASMFIVIAGTSFAISYGKNKDAKKNLKRGMKIFGLGLLITAATFITFPQYTIWFGILHLIGLSAILSVLFVRLGRLNAAFAAAFIAAGIYLGNFRVDTSWLLWLGFQPSGFKTFDYFPLLPWFGAMLIGLFAGNELYMKGKRRYHIFKEPKIAKPVGFLGRHSLLIYLTHQIVLIAALLLLGAVSFQSFV